MIAAHELSLLLAAVIFPQSTVCRKNVRGIRDGLLPVVKLAPSR